MYQVLLRIPFPGLDDGIPVYGFGMMLFLAFVICTWLASRRAAQVGIAPEHIQDLAIWIFIGGIVGARLTFLIVEEQPLSSFFYIWDGGLVFYGSALGGVAGYALAYRFVIRKHGLSSWKLADIIAPSVAIGLSLGRIGCFLNGCCYGQVACPDCCGVSFPLPSPPRYALVKDGLQTPAGFTMSDRPRADDRTVGAVDPSSPAFASGLRPGDVIVRAGSERGSHADVRPISSYADLWDCLGHGWRRGASQLALTVVRDGQEIDLEPFAPRTLRLHPTQLYSSIGAFLIFLLLLAYHPFRRRDGAVMALLMLCYPVERFLEEALRNDTRPVSVAGYSTHMTLSQNISILIFAAGLGLALWLWRRPVQYPARSPA